MSKRKKQIMSEVICHVYVLKVHTKAVHLGPYGFEVCRLHEATFFDKLKTAKQFFPMLKEQFGDDAGIDEVEMKYILVHLDT